jgi:putative peptide zinc metalloprotease protein
MNSSGRAQTRRYTFNDAVQFLPLESGSAKMLMCEVAAAGGAVSRFALPLSVVECLRLFDGEREPGGVAAAYRELHADSTYTAENLGHLAETFCVPKGILLDPERSESVEEPAQKPRGYLYARVPLLPPRIVYPLARACSWLFYKPLLTLLLTAAAAAHVIFYSWAVHIYHIDINHFKGRPLIAVTLWAMLAAIFHEFGHAAALARHGCRKLEIGFGLYLHIPVLYADVSEAWRLRPLDRAIVDIGGIYFQSLFVIAFLILLMVQGSVTWAYAIVVIDLSIAFSMNPFLRMDGYWLVADLFGMWRLRAQSIQVLKHYALRLVGSVHAGRNPLADLSAVSAAVLCLYTFLSTGFFIWLTAVMSYQVIFILGPVYPALVASAARTIGAHPFDIAVISGSVLEVGWKSMMLAGCLMFLWRRLRGGLTYTARFGSMVARRLAIFAPE